MHKTSTVQKFATLIRMSLTAYLSLCAAASVPATAQGVQPFSVEMTMTTPGSIAQGEPIILHYRFSNNTGQDIRTAQGTDKKEWYAIRVTNASGGVIPSEDRTRPLHAWEISHANGCIVQSHEYYQDDLVPIYRFPRPGKYILSVHVRVPYGAEGDPVAIRYKPIEDTFTASYEGDYQFPLTVTAPDVARLQTDAQALEKKAAMSFNNQGSVAALCSMPEAQAAPSWRALADDPRADMPTKVELAKQLVLLHTSKAVDVLSSMVWNPDRPIGASAMEWLIQAYLVGGNAVKQQVRASYGQHGVPFPAHPAFQEVND